MPVLKKLMEAQYGPWFSEPVDPIKLNIPDYPTIVKRPMDLGTIKRRLDSGSHYRTFHDFQVDVDLVWYNARLYNPQDHQVHQIAVQYQRNFREMFKKVEDEFQTEVKRKYDDGNTCRLCGGTRLKFDAAILHCNGPCGQKIRRNSRYYASPDNKFHWCANCYERLEDTIITVESELRKSDLIQKKNNEQAEESWVQCDHCRGWFHQICALFNGKRNENNPSKKKAFHCALCILKRLGKNNTGPAFPGARRLVAKSALPPLCCVGWLVVGWCSAACSDPPCPLSCAVRATDLPDNALSKFLEKRLHDMLARLRRQHAEDSRIPLDKVPRVTDVCVRVVCQVPKMHFVKPKMMERYHDKDPESYPAEFPYTSKVILLFQKIDGLDVLIFGMYVQEYGSDCPPPNQRTVYLSYLDSVKYFKPGIYRTQTYHELLVSYLEYVKKRGFNQLVLWACPPVKGDDYILYAHPPNQRTPKPDRLREWYQQMLDIAQQRRVVEEVTTVYDEYFPPDSVRRLTDVPYYEGDYWPGIAEEFIVKATEGAGTDADGDVAMPPASKATKSKAKSKAKSKRKSRRGASRGGKQRKKPMGRQPGDPGYDSVYEEIAKTMKTMRADFMVAKLRPTCRVCRKYVDGDMRYHCELCAAAGTLYDLCPDCHTQRPGVHDHKLNACKQTPVAKVTADADTNNENDFFDTRQRFLELCVGNHYQFDQMRRAKHSSMMLLWHLFHPSAPAFVHSCNKCGVNIETGTRWACAKCPEFDLCDNCYRTERHPHQMKGHPVVGTGEDSDEDDNSALEKMYVAVCARRAAVLTVTPLTLPSPPSTTTGARASGPSSCTCNSWNTRRRATASSARPPTAAR